MKLPAGLLGPWPWCLLALALSAGLALVPLQGLPHVTDEIAYTLQARVFAAGLRVAPGAPQPSLLLFPFWDAAGGYSPFPPGWPALLSVGERVGAAAWVNPLLCGLLPLLVWLLGREWGDAAMARRAAALVAVSPALLLLGASRMSHVSVILGLGAALVVAQRARDRPWAWWLAGAGVAYVVLARPFDAALLGGPLLLWGLHRGRSLARAAPLLLLPGLAAALLLADNALLTGDPLRFPMSAFFDGWVEDPSRAGCNRLGFGADVGCFPTFGSWGHSPGKALRIAGDSALRLDSQLIGIPGAGALALVGLAWGRRWLALVGIGALVLGYALYWSPGMAYGARFWSPALLLLPLGLAPLLGRLGRLALPLILAVGLAGTARMLPDLANRWWCVDGELSRMLAAAGATDGVVFIDGRGSRPMAWPRLGVEAFVCDPLLESGDGFLLWDPSDLRGGLQPRHGLRNPATTLDYLDRYHPGARAWNAVHDVSRDRWTLEEIQRTQDAPTR